MKKLLYIVPSLLLFGCSNFLDEVDKDKLIPEKTDHYAALLLNEFSSSYAVFRDIDYMTDNVIEDPAALTSAKFGNKTTYTWQREIEIDENGKTVSNNNAWRNIYQDVAVCNYILEYIDSAIGTQQENDFVKGEAFFVRAFSYFNLVNLYGQPYNSGDPNIILGVPLRTNTGVETSYDRNTVAECYAQIESDLQSAIDLISGSGITKSIWHPNLETCNLLMSRVKLFQEKWQESIDYANKVIASRSLSKMTYASAFINASNTEVLYSYYTTNPLFKLYSSGTTLNTVNYRANLELVNLYESTDLRKNAYFLGIDDGSGKLWYRTKKYELGLFSSLGFANFRVAEAYLNRAEAQAQLRLVDNAVNDLKLLHNSRYSSTASIVYPTTAEEVIAMTFKERRKEFCFEDHFRWFDLRRMSNRPEIKHVFTLSEDDGTKLGTETYTLLANDPNYTLPIPLTERENNPGIRNNERYEKIPVIAD